MKINQIIINETTTAGAVATVAKPMGETQVRTKVRGLEPAEKVMKGKAKKQGPYANSLSESKNKVEEAKLDEDDLIVVPGQGIKRKTGFVQHGQSRVDHEVEMARSDVLATMKNAKAIYQLLKDRSEDEGIEGWVQEKLIKANDYLNSVKEYYDEKMMREMTGGVIAAGGVGEGVAEGKLGSLASPAGSRLAQIQSQAMALSRKANAVGVGKEWVHMIKTGSTKEIDAALDLAWDERDDAASTGILTSLQEIVNYLTGESNYLPSKIKEQGVAEGSLKEGQYEMMLRNGQVKKFVAKDDADAKRIAAGHGAKSVIKLKGGVPAGKVAEGAKVDRMVKHIAKSERETGKSSKEAENIAWATVNKRGYLDNKNKKKGK